VTLLTGGEVYHRVNAGQQAFEVNGFARWRDSIRWDKGHAVRGSSYLDDRVASRPKVWAEVAADEAAGTGHGDLHADVVM
jgi:hypothetical protein